MSFLANTAYAQGVFSEVQKNAGISGLITKIINAIVVPLVGLLFMLAMIVFVWGLFGLIAKGADPAARKLGQDHVLWGVIGMLIMVSVFGIIRVIGNTVGVDPFL